MLLSMRLDQIMRRFGGALAVLITAGFLGACPHATGPVAGPTTGPAGHVNEDEGPVVLARRSSTYVPLTMARVVVGTKIQMSAGGAAGIGVRIYSTRVHRSPVSSPMADQLMGTARVSADTGSYLVPLPNVEKDGVRTFLVTEPMPLFVKVDVSSTAEPGAVVIPLTVQEPKGAPEKRELALNVSEVVLPTEPRILAAATTTVDELSRLFPATFGSFNATYMDRGAEEHAAAVDQLDILVKAAQAEGVALFVEDLSPAVKVDDVGKVSVDWDAYDRVMSPYMDGSAFADRVPLQVWLAPVPPRRIRETPTQLRQYLANCVDHFVAKGWIATPAVLHPAMVDPGTASALRDEIGKILRMHLSKDVLAVTTPDAVIPQPRLWVVDDSDSRLPPAGALGNAESVRLWPWVSAARGARGFVWRGAVERAGETRNVKRETRNDGTDDLGENRPLFVADIETGKGGKDARGGEVVRVWVTQRMAWLGEGLNDAAMFGLLEKRGDPTVVSEVLAGVVGRTGLTVAQPGGELPSPPTGFLYAGWPTERRAWARLPSLMEKLVMANEPGQRAIVALEDPVYLQAKMWLAEAHRPVARVAGYTFSVTPGREGPVVETGLELLLENPVDSAAQFTMRFAGLPGDFGVALGGREVAVPAYGLSRVAVMAAGHLDALRESPHVTPVDISERNGGAMIRLPVLVPVHRMREVGTAGPPKIDGRGDDWPQDSATRSFGPMPVGLRYLSRVDLLAGKAREEAEGASVKWTYDADYVYALVRCTQAVVVEEKTNEWPIVQRRWWGADGVQILISGGTSPAGKDVYRLGFKPGGVALVRVAKVEKVEVGKKQVEPVWADGPTGMKYGMVTDREGYTIEVAIPRKWFGKGAAVGDPMGGGRADVPATWRVNVLRHRASESASSSWSGPVVDDLDLGMMGLLVGE